MDDGNGWVSFHCPCCQIGFDYPDVDGVPQWQKTTCFGAPLTVEQIHECQCHYTGEGVQDSFGPVDG